MRYSQNGTPITNFSLAVNRRRRQQDGNFTDETDWFRVTLFRQQAENANEWLKRGSKVLVEGQLQIRNYTGNDGVERTSVDVNADNFMNLTPRDGVEGETSSRTSEYRPRAERDREPTPIQGAPSTRGRTPERSDPFTDDDDFDDVPF